MSSARRTPAASAIASTVTRAFEHRRASGAAVVECGQAVAVGELVERELPRLDGVADAADQESGPYPTRST
jgi:hypothetical protein